MIARLRTCWPLVLVTLAALVLRLWDVGARPMHADEANQAFKMGALLEDGEYRFDPHDHHGPTLYYFAALATWLSGARAAAELNETMLRVVPAIFSALTVFGVGWWASRWGKGVGVTAAGVLALAPASVYYGRYFIQETLLTAFLVAFVVAIAGARATPSRWRWIAAGACVGMMLATKLSALIFLGAAIVAFFVTRERTRPFSSAKSDVLWALAVALIVATAFYASFGRNVPGVSDWFESWFTMSRRATGGSPHDKPWFYYGQIHLGFRSGGRWWDQSVFLLAAVTGGVFAWRSRECRAARAVAVFVVLVVVVLSAAPYKTPWQILSVLPAMACLAAFALGHLPRLARWVASGFILLALVWQTQQAVFRFPADPRNPYAYVHSSPDVRKLETLARDLKPDAVIIVAAPEYWPVPWYLRRHANTGYWTALPDGISEAAMWVVAVEYADELRARLPGAWREDFIGLRPGRLLVVFRRPDPA